MRFLLLDRVDHLDVGREARGVKNITLTDEVFDEHFPDHPVYPGTLVVEAAAQLGGFLCECSFHAKNEETRRAVLMQIRQAKFHRPCRPGDQLRLSATLQHELDTAMGIQAVVRVGEATVAEVGLTFRLIEVDSPALHLRRQSIYRQWLQDLSHNATIR